MSCTSCGEWVAASTLGDGWVPMRLDRRCTRPPSSSTLTASGSGPPAFESSGKVPSDNIDRSVQLPMKMPPTWWSTTTLRASAAPVTPTISELRQLVPQRHGGKQVLTVTASRQRGRRDRRCDGAGRLLRAGRRRRLTLVPVAKHEERHRRQHENRQDRRHRGADSDQRLALARRGSGVSSGRGSSSGAPVGNGMRGIVTRRVGRDARATLAGWIGSSCPPRPASSSGCCSALRPFSA